MNASLSHNTIIANGISLHYVTQGEGPLMLLLHGFPEYWYTWRYQIPEFAKDYKVVALDLRGYNESDKPKQQSAYKLDEIIRDVKDVIESLGYKSCLLIGHDWGAYIAWHFAYKYPELVHRLIILNIPHPARFAKGILSFDQLRRSWYLLLFKIPILPEILMRVNLFYVLKQVFRSMAFNQSAFTDEVIQVYAESLAIPGTLTAAINYYRSVPVSLVLKTSWDILCVPTLMIWGEEDTVLSRTLAEGTESYVENFRIKYISRCGHWPHEEEPNQVNSYIREFIQ